MADGINDLTITIDTDADHAVEDINALQDEVKDLNAEIEYTLDLLDELEEREGPRDVREIPEGAEHVEMVPDHVPMQMRTNDGRNFDERLRLLEKRFLHGECDGDE